MKSAKNKHKKDKRKHSRKSSSMSAKADRHKLYELSVQDVSHEYDFIKKTFREIRGYKAKALREDFCGTAKMCCEWVRKRGKNTAVGVDIDPEVLSWGKKHNLGKLKSAARKRITLLQEDVVTVSAEPAQVILAMNFSYQLFKQRDQLRKYFENVQTVSYTHLTLPTICFKCSCRWGAGDY